MSLNCPMIRLSPIQHEDLPEHPTFDKQKGASTITTEGNRPELLPFALTLLDQGRALLLPREFNLHFKHHSQKASPPSNNEVEVLSAHVAAADISGLAWSTPELPRSKPHKLGDEHWYARRSYHHNISVKRNSPGTASWDEFVYGLRDNHSKNEANFTPTIYDARYILDWDVELNMLLENHPRADAPNYSHATMRIFEMCHKMPSITESRCFPVLVLTASVSPSEFIAVTVPVNISSLPGAFYSNKRNRTEATDSQQKSSVTLGNYVAVERVHKYRNATTHTDAEGHSHTHSEVGATKHTRSHEEAEEEIEWVMATASHTKGQIPMVMQRMGVPGAIVKDVGLFLKWIHKVPDEDMREARKDQ